MESSVMFSLAGLSASKNWNVYPRRQTEMATSGGAGRQRVSKRQMNFYSVHIMMKGRLVSVGREAETAMAAIIDALQALRVDLRMVDGIEVNLLSC